MFYDADNEWPVATFNSIIEICTYLNKEPTTNNLNKIRSCLITALKKYPHTTKMLRGTLMHVHVIDNE